VALALPEYDVLPQRAFQRHGLDQQAELRPAENPGEAGPSGGRHRRGPRQPGQRGQLAERLARAAQREQRLRPVGPHHGHLHRAFGEHVDRVAALALADDPLPGGEAARHPGPQEPRPLLVRDERAETLSAHSAPFRTRPRGYSVIPGGPLRSRFALSLTGSGHPARGLFRPERPPARPRRMLRPPATEASAGASGLVRPHHRRPSGAGPAAARRRAGRGDRAAGGVRGARRRGSTRRGPARPGAPVTLRGRLAPGPAGVLEGPASQEACVWWQVAARLLRNGGGVPDFPERTASEESFRLTDDAGEASVLVALGTEGLHGTVTAWYCEEKQYGFSDYPDIPVARRVRA